MSECDSTTPTAAGKAAKPGRPHPDFPFFRWWIRAPTCDDFTRFPTKCLFRARGPLRIHVACCLFRESHSSFFDTREAPDL